MNSVYGDLHWTVWVRFDLVVRAAWSFRQRYNLAPVELRSSLYRYKLSLPVYAWGVWLSISANLCDVV